MSQFLRRVSHLALGLSFVLPAFAAAPSVRLVVSLPPQATWVQALAGERAEVTAFLNSGAACGAFDPKPSDLARLAAAQAFVAAGVGYENALREHLPSGPQALRWVSLDPEAESPSACAGCGGHPADAAEGHAGHDHAAHDHAPHTWVSPRRVLGQLEALRALLTELDPAGAEIYRARHAQFAARVAALDAEVRRRLEPHQGRAFLVYHPAYAEFAADYGLREISIQEEGKEPGPRQVARAIGEARAGGVRDVLVQPYEQNGSARAVAGSLGGTLRVVDIMDPDWEGGVRRLVEALEAALTPVGSS